MFHTANAEHPDYVPLALRASELWDEYSKIGRAQLLTRCGMLSLGPPEGDFIRGMLNSAAIHGLETRRYASDEIGKMYPAFSPDDGDVGVFETKAGWIDTNAAIETALRLAKLSGATLRPGEPVLQWIHERDHFEVTTASGTVAAERLIITAGAWSAQLFQQLGLPLRVERKASIWIDPINPALFHPNVFPVFALSKHFLNGFPAIGGRGVKLAIHFEPGQPTLEPAYETNLDEAAESLRLTAKLLPQLAGSLPHAIQRVNQIKSCLYVMSRDEHFFVDRHPDWPNLVFAAGFSGQGFRFAPAIGEVLADLVTTGVPRVPIGLMSMSRLREIKTRQTMTHSQS